MDDVPVWALEKPIILSGVLNSGAKVNLIVSRIPLDDGNKRLSIIFDEMLSRLNGDVPRDHRPVV